MRRRCLIAAFFALLLIAFAALGFVAREALKVSAESMSGEESTPSPTPEPQKAEERVNTSLRLSEVMSSNESCVLGGAVTDWVELVNEGEESVSLGEYYLSKDADSLFACPLPEQTLEPGGYIVLRSEKELNFRIGKDGETLYLSSRAAPRFDSLRVPALESDESYTREGFVTRLPTPGAENTEEAGRRFASPHGLCINELCASCDKERKDGSPTTDWVELYNAGEESVTLSDYCLSDSRKTLPGTPLPDTVLAPGEYAVILCSGADDGNMPFSLSAAGEKLYLSRADGELAEVFAYPKLSRDRSWGRSGSERVYFASPTPGGVNGTGYATISASPEASSPSGFYGGSFAVTLSGAGTIRYTTDGTTPTESSRVYAGESIPVEQSMSLRAYAVDGDHIPSGVVTWNYFLSLPEYELDLVRVSMSPGKAKGALSQDDSTGKYSANIALYHDGNEEFNLPCSISVFGSGSRVYGKKSYQIDFSALYGESELNYRLFDAREIDTYKTFTLRSGSQDQVYATMRDELLTSIFDECSPSLITLAYRPVNLYINNDYRGVYYIRERTDEETFAALDGCRESDVDICKKITVRYGNSRSASNELSETLKFIRSNSMAIEENFAYAEERIDMDSLIDFFIAQMWSTNYDIDNARVIRTPADGGRWRFLLYDLDVAFLQPNEGSVDRMYNAYSGLLKALMQNAGFKERCTRRLSELLRGPLREETVLARLDAFRDTVAHDMVYNFERWKGLCTYDKWESQVRLLREGKNIGIRGWTDPFIRQYISVIQPSEALIRECFGEQYLQ